MKKKANEYHEQKTSEIKGLAWEFRRILEFVLFELMITFGQRIGSSLRKEKHQWPSSIYVWEINLSVFFAPVNDTSHSVVYSLCVCARKSTGESSTFITSNQSRLNKSTFRKKEKTLNMYWILRLLLLKSNTTILPISLFLFAKSYFEAERDKKNRHNGKERVFLYCFFSWTEHLFVALFTFRKYTKLTTNETEQQILTNRDDNNEIRL